MLSNLLPQLTRRRSPRTISLAAWTLLIFPTKNTRDDRYVLDYIPGVALDQTAQPHVAGGETHQALTSLDDSTLLARERQLLARVSTDAIRT